MPPCTRERERERARRCEGDRTECDTRAAHSLLRDLSAVGTRAGRIVGHRMGSGPRVSVHFVPHPPTTHSLLCLSLPRWNLPDCVRCRCLALALIPGRPGAECMILVMAPVPKVGAYLCPHTSLHNTAHRSPSPCPTLLARWLAPPASTTPPPPPRTPRPSGKGGRRSGLSLDSRSAPPHQCRGLRSAG